MQPDERDVSYLWDIVESAKAAQKFTDGLTYSDFLSNRLVRRSVERELQIIGEAAKRLSDNFKLEFSDIPWGSITGLRNVLVHEYGDVKYELVWNAVQTRIPVLIN